MFETLLNALPPDYYYSAHFPDDRQHINPDLQTAYSDWFGEDAAGKRIADYACAGYGWSEAFYAPRKQISMINDQLIERHSISLQELLLKKIGK